MSYEVTYRLPESGEIQPVQLIKLVNADGKDVTTRSKAWTKSSRVSMNTADELSEAIINFREFESDDS